MKYGTVQEYGKQHDPEKETYHKIEIGNNHRGIFYSGNRNKDIAYNRNKPCRIKMVHFEIMLYPETDGFKHENRMKYNSQPPQRDRENGIIRVKRDGK